MVRRFLAAVMLVGVWASAAPAQKTYVRPPAQPPAVFRGNDPAAPVDQTSIGDLRWFEVFQDPALQELVRTAMVRNYDLLAAVTRINAERANLGLARSDQFPQFEAGADLTTTRTSKNGPDSFLTNTGRN